MKLKQLKRKYIEWMGIIIVTLALVRCIFPGIAEPRGANETDDTVETNESEELCQTYSHALKTYRQRGETPHRIKSVSNYDEAFPDSNYVQLQAATAWGVQPVKNRQDAELRKDELVYIGFSPYYLVDQLSASIPYLVPRAAILTQDIGLAFMDSLQAKGLPLHRIIVTSVLRTEEDVRRLRRTNKNATEQSCHLYGTTLDISYTRFETFAKVRPVRDDSLKWVLSEVLRDMRQQGRCYVKYEHRQSCFHLTVR
jgi:hypothetical protein